jgi:hypothetical protein
MSLCTQKGRKMKPSKKILAGFQVLFGSGIQQGVTPEVWVTTSKRTFKMVRCDIGTPVVGVITRSGWQVAAIQSEEKYVWLAPGESEPRIGSLVKLLQEFLKDKGDGVFDIILAFKKEVEETKASKKDDETFIDLLYKQAEMVSSTISSTYSSVVEYVTNIPKIFS